MRRLLASIHDVSPLTAPAVDALLHRLAPHVGHAIALLVIPDHWNRAPIADDRPFQRRLRAWADAGHELFLHGWSHRDEAPAGLAARHMTAGEGEFAALAEAEAARRIARGKALLEDVTGRPLAGFVAPAWLYGPGAQAALAGAGLPLAEDHFRVWQPGSGRVLARGPVISWASRSRARIAASLGFAALARIGLKPLPTVRVAVHPGDAAVPALLASIDATLARFARSHRPARYGDLMA